MYGKRQHLRGGLFATPDRRRFKGSSGTNTVTQQSGPPQQVLQNYQNVFNQAQSVAQQPPPVYNGSLVAGFTPMQTAGFNNVNTAVNAGQPFLNAASQDATNATSLMSPQNFGSTVAAYQSPYTQQVVNATQGLFNEQNAEQQAQIGGNAISAGAFGGDRQAVAQAETARQQQLAQAPVLAGLENTGFQNATNTAQGNAWLNSQGAFSLGNLGQEAQSLGLQGASAQMTAGGLQQQQGQQELNVPYQQWLAAQAYPYQMTNFLGGIAEGTGSLSGGTGSTTSPAPSTLSQGLGLGLAGAGILGQTGAFGSNGYLSGMFGGGASGGFGSLPVGSIFPSGGNRGGRITGLAAGGGAFPGDPPEFGFSVPDASINLIPGAQLGAGAPTMMANSGTTSTTDGGGGGSGVLGNLIGLGSLAAGFLQSGGRIAGLAPGGAVPDPTTGMPYGDSAAPHPDHVPGRGPPAPPPAWHDPGLSASLGGLGSVAGMIQSASRETGGRVRMGYDVGGGVPSGMLNARFNGNPMETGLYQQYASMPTEQLQERVAMMPPGSPYAQFAQMALQQRHMAPQSDPGQQQPQVGSTPQPGIAGFGPLQGLADGGMPVDSGVWDDASPDADWTAPPQGGADLGTAAPQGVAGHTAGLGTAPGADAASGPWGTMLATGLGILSGTSPNAGVNIGRGGLEGLSYAQKQRQVAEESALRRAQMQNTAAYQSGELGYRAAALSQMGHVEDARLNQEGALAKARLAQTAAIENARLGLEGRSLDETQRYHDTISNEGRWIAGYGPDNSGNQVPGMYFAGRDGSAPVFHPGVNSAQLQSQDLRKRAFDETVKQHGIVNDQKAQTAEAARVKGASDAAIRLYLGSRDITGKPQMTLEQAEAKAAALRPAAAPTVAPPQAAAPAGRSQAAAPPPMMPPPGAVSLLKAHPELAPQFIAKYGSDAYSGIFGAKPPNAVPTYTPAVPTN